MSESGQSEYRIPEPEQEISNRSILRIQQLSKELADELDKLPIFQNSGWSIAKVLFAARDYSDPDPSKRWYNFRLCDSYRFPSDVKPWLDSNKSRFICLFEAANLVERTRASFDSFDRALLTKDFREAYEEMIIALAVLPYAGVILDLLETSFFGNKDLNQTLSLLPSCILFEPIGENVCSLDLSSFSIGQELGTLNGSKVNTTRFHPKLSRLEKDLKSLFEDFLLPFTRGAPPKLDGQRGNQIPYEKQVSDLMGFAIPAYDAFDGESYRGGMAGWIVVVLTQKNPANKTDKSIKGFFEAKKSEEQNPPQSVENELELQLIKSKREAAQFRREVSWEMLQQLMETYVRRVREAQMLDVVEEYGDLKQPPSAEAFFLEHIRRICDLRVLANPDDSLARIMKNGRKDRVVTLPYEMPLRDSIVFDEASTEKPSMRDVEVSIERLAKTFLQLLKYAENQHRSGQQSGMLASAHDYSKDLNAIDSTFGRLSTSLDESVKLIKKSIASDPGISSANGKITATLEMLSKTRDYSLIRPRFLMAHARTQTEGYYYEQPEWLVQRLVNSSLADFYFLFRLLVWEPVGSAHYLDLVSKPPERQEVADWSRLFAYDEVGVHPEFDILLADYLKKLFLRPVEAGGPMSHEDFGRIHPPPTLNPKNEMGDILLPGLRERSIGVRGLLPLIVFSLRAGFQHAWLTTFLKAASHDTDSGPFAPVTEPVTLSEENGPTSYAVRISFPNPLSVPVRVGRPLPKEQLGGSPVLPWGNWSRDVAFYGGLGLPWSPRLTSSADRKTFNIYISATIKP